MKKLLLVCGFIVMLAGCQTVPQTTQVLDNSTFMNLWSTYRHCTSGNDLAQLRGDVKALTQATATGFHTSPTNFSVPLPDLLLQHVSAQPTRVAADPRAMVAACSIHTAEVAIEAGKDEVAAELLNGILRSYSQTEYVYYVRRAETTLHRMQAEVLLVGRSTVVPSQQGKVLPVPAVKYARPPLPQAADPSQYE